MFFKLIIFVSELKQPNNSTVPPLPTFNSVPPCVCSITLEFNVIIKMQKAIMSYLLSGEGDQVTREGFFSPFLFVQLV